MSVCVCMYACQNHLQSSFVASDKESSSRARWIAARAKASTAGTSALWFHLLFQAFGTCTPRRTASRHKICTSHFSLNPSASRSHVNRSIVFWVTRVSSPTGPLYLSRNANHANANVKSWTTIRTCRDAHNWAHARYFHVGSAQPPVQPSPGSQGWIGSDQRKRLRIFRFRHGGLRDTDSWASWKCTPILWHRLAAQLTSTNKHKTNAIRQAPPAAHSSYSDAFPQIVTHWNHTALDHPQRKKTIM